MCGALSSMDDRMLECAMSKAFLKNGSLILISVEGRPVRNRIMILASPPSVERIRVR